MEKHNRKIKSKLIEAKKNIRKKLLILRKGVQEENIQREKFLQPLAEPIKQLVLKEEKIKKEPVKLEEKTEPEEEEEKFSFKKIRIKKPIRNLSDDEVFQTMGEQAEKNDSNSEDERQLEMRETILKNENSPQVQEFLNAFDPLPRLYLIKYLDGDGIDKKGIKYQVEKDKWMLGNTPVEIEGKDFIVNNEKFVGTPGLYELLFMTIPDENKVHTKDIENYKKIIRKTNLYRRNFSSTQQITGSKGEKYRKYVKPMLANQRVRAKTISFFPKDEDDDITEGRGYLIANNKKIDYRYFDDPNELIERLVLLKSSERAGNTGVHNEIIAIEDELKELNIIR